VTGFLARMAARAAGGAPAVSPRGPARFEPTAAMALPEETLPVAVPSARPVRTVAASATPESDPAASSLQRRRDEPARTTDPSPVSPRPPNPRAPVPEGDRAAASGLVVGTPAGLLDTPAGTGATAASVRIPPTSTPPEPSEPVLTVRGEEPSPMRPRQLAVVTAIPAPDVSDVLATLPTGERSRRQERIGRTASASDVVHVSIGRVDVRATVASPAQAPPPTQPSNQPSEEALSLHDYLLGRRGAS
jgi:hypothetical protein